MSCVRSTIREEGRLLELVLDRPKGNILDMAMMGELQAALAEHTANAHLRLVVLRGAGGHFSFGASVEEHHATRAAQMLATFHALCRQVAAYPVPVAALVDGQCLGGAFELAICCHLVFAGPKAAFGCPELKLGVFPPVLAAIGALRLGGALAERLLLTGESIDAETARRCGLVAQVFVEGDFGDALRNWFSTHLAGKSAWALRQAVQALRPSGTGLLEALGAPLDRLERLYLDRIVTSHDGNEGLAAFSERRQPVWEDR